MEVNISGEKLLTPTVMLIFGATGDLSYRKLIPAIFNLSIEDVLPDQFQVIGISRSEMSVDELHQKYEDGITNFSRRPLDATIWQSLKPKITYVSGDFNDATLYLKLDESIAEFQKNSGKPCQVIVYMAVAPMFFEIITGHFGKLSWTKKRKQTRFVFEKPFGHDLESAIKLNESIRSVLKEEQIFRIDHYLGKETVQNLLAFRFANTFFEPLWNKNYIEWVQISALEKVGLEGRGEYYDKSGAMRDMVQNHMLQLLCMIAMEPPVSFHADDIRNKKSDVLKAVRCYGHENAIYKNTVRGQYGNGHEGPEYRHEPKVNPQSNTETYTAARFFIDSWRWQDVPFYIRTGKNLSLKATYIVVKFKPAPHFSFPAASTHNWESNMLVFNINPGMDITLSFQAKVPGQKMLLDKVDMVFNFEEELTASTPEAYEHLIYDVFENDLTLFMRSDQVEYAWKIIDPIIKSWEKTTATNFPNYKPGSYGPAEADSLLAEHGHVWLNL